MFGELFNIFIQKKTVEAVVAEKPGTGKAFSRLFVSMLIAYSFASFAVYSIDPELAPLLGSDAPFVLAGSVSVMIVISLLVTYIGALLYFVFGRFVGGKGGGYVQFANNFALLTSSVFLFTAFSPVIDEIIKIDLVSTLANIYLLYFGYRLIKSYFALPTKQALLALFAPTIIGVAVLAVLGAMLAFISFI